MSSDETRSGASTWEMPDIFTVEYLTLPSSRWPAELSARDPQPQLCDVINRRPPGERGAAAWMPHVGTDRSVWQPLYLS